jgi:hypothetical protein
VDDSRQVIVEFKEREAFAVLVALGLAGGLLKRDTKAFDSLVGEALAEIKPGAFVGHRQWQADSITAGFRIWKALGLEGTGAA